MVVLLAHGTFNEENPEQSFFQLVDVQGKSAMLTAEMLANSPDLLRGSTLVLLSCEAGAAGGLSAAPEGLAGVLLAVGARAVVAPTRVVMSDAAFRVGEQLCRAALKGEDMPAALQRSVGNRRASGGSTSVALEALFGAASFVVWAGGG